MSFADVGPVDLSDTAAVLPVGASGRLNRVLAITAETPRGQVVARSAFSRGFTNWAVTTDQWVAWVDQSQKQTDENHDVLWRIWARNLVTGQKTLLDSNGHEPDPYVPQLHAADGFIAWATAEPDRTALEKLWKVGAQRPAPILQGAQLSPEFQSLDVGRLIYLGKSAVSDPEAVAGDCWSVRLGGGVATALTHTGSAVACDAASGTLAWFEHIDPRSDAVPELDGVLDNPWEVWEVSLSDENSTPKLLHQGYIQGARPVVGRGFIAWLGDDANRPISVWTHAGV